MLEVQSYGAASRLLTVTIDETAGDRLRALRIARGLTLREAARLAGLSHGTIQNLEKGISNPDNVLEGTYKGLARAYGKTPQAIRDLIAGEELYAGSGASGAAILEAHPDWVQLPVFPAGNAGSQRPKAVPGEVAFVPRQRLAERQTKVEDIAAYLVDQSCLISEEAQRAPRAPVWHDHITISKTAQPAPGELVACWWPAAQKLTITRHGIDTCDVVCYPFRPGSQAVILPAIDDLELLGPIIYRGG